MTQSTEPTAPQAQPQAMPTIIIQNNNTASAVASATAVAHGGRAYRKQSLWVHFWLFCCTCGIGNYFYARHINRWNRGY
ncbi:hypothetical protein [Catellatospora sp. NPDC049609]|uniref:hypothetical protein n=1 Tax=Catellatospora sp. NPDC049609 TaxID=3155505 RepID=UPI00343A469D